MKDELEEVIDEVSPGSFLARLWRMIIFKDGYIKYIIPRTNDYISKICIKSELSNTKISINKTNIQNKIISSDMTWKNLIFLLKEIIIVSNIEVIIKIRKNNEDKTYSEKGLSTEALTKIWLQIKKDHIDELPTLIDNYINRSKATNTAITETNLNKKIDTTKAMSWKTLVFLIDEVLYAESVLLEIVVEHKGKTYSSHKLEYYIGNKG